MKYLWDQGTIRDDVVVCTGSSAVDLQRGAAERLPGRRGAGIDHLVLPQSFAAFAHAVGENIPPSPGLTVAELREPDGEALLAEMRLHGPALERALRGYLRFGGLPAAVAEALSGAHEPSAGVKRVVEDSLVREIQRRGASMPAARALLERVVRSLGSKISWSSMAREMDVPLGRGKKGRPSHQTLRDYIELLAGGYFLFVAYFWRSGSQTNEQSRDKKVFFADPLLHTIALDHAPGLSTDTAALVENVIGMALLRRYEPADRLIETFPARAPTHLADSAGRGDRLRRRPPFRARPRRGQVSRAARAVGRRCRRANPSGAPDGPGNEEHAAVRRALHAPPSAHAALGTRLSRTQAFKPTPGSAMGTVRCP